MHISCQAMQFFKHDTLVRTYVISTSSRPPSNVRNSLGTPRGLHEIAERIGAEQPAGMVFKSRTPTGFHYSELGEQEQQGNLVTSRILWLRGLEAGINLGGEVDTYERYIYVHGTNHEDRLGSPQSAGCVLMSNREIVDLYEEVRRGDHVLIID
ncbi:MAG: L,D-transpeptidase [Opitutaceae bacterium]|nr:L,D-transpeptidase [Opitutaceae bacterium]